MMYLIWKDEYQQWWAPDRLGYVFSVAEAGRYTAEQAADIMASDIPKRNRLVRETEAKDGRWPASGKLRIVETPHSDRLLDVIDEAANTARSLNQHLTLSCGGKNGPCVLCGETEPFEHPCSGSHHV